METLGAAATVAGLVSTVAALATTLSRLLERYRYAALNITLVTGSLWTIKAALEQVEDWRTTAADKTRSSRQLDRDLQISLESCALVVAVIERKLSETDLSRPSFVDKVRYVNLDAIYKDFIAHLDGQIRALHLLLTIFQCRTTTEQKEKLDQQETRSVLQQVQNSAASLQLEERDLQDAASILSEDPSITLDVDAILMNHPLYQRVYKNHAQKQYRQLPSLTRTISRKPLGHTKSKSADHVERLKGARSVDPLSAQYAALPFLGLPFKGESPQLPEEDLQGKEEYTGDTGSVKELNVDEVQPVDAVISGKASEQLDVPEQLAMTINVSAEKESNVLGNGNAYEHRAHEVLASNSNIAPYIAELSSSRNVDDSIKTPKDRPSIALSEEPASISPSVALSQTTVVPSIHLVLETLLPSGSPKSRTHSIVSSSTSVINIQSPVLATTDIGSELPAVEESSHTDNPFRDRHTSLNVTAPDEQHSPNVREKALNKNSRTSSGIKASSGIEVLVSDDTRPYTTPGSSVFDINFGPDPVLDIADLKATSDLKESREEIRLEKKSSMPTTPTFTPMNKGDSSRTLPQEAASPKLPSLTAGPSLEVPPPIPVVVEPTSSNVEEAVHHVAGTPSEARERASMPTGAMRKDYPAEREGSLSSSESQGLQTLESTPTVSTQTQATTISSDSVRSSHERAQSELRQLQLEHNDAKGKGNAQTAKDTIKKSIAIIQKTYLSGLSNGLQAEEKSPKRLSSIARLSIVSLNPQAEKGRAINTAASTGNFQQLVQLLEQNPRMMDTLTSQADSLGTTHSRTPLMCAAIAGHIPCMEILRSYSANPAAIDKQGRTALHLAVEARQHEVIKWLLQSGVEVVTIGGHQIRSMKFVDLSDADGLTALHIAAGTGQVEMIDTLVAHDANLEAMDKWRRTPLHYAVINLQDASAAGLLDKGSNINALDDTKSSPLLWSVKVNSMTSITRLSQQGADSKLQDIDGETAIHHASRVGNLAAINMLYTELEELDAKNKLGETPLHIASSLDHSLVVGALLQAGVQVNPWTEPPPAKSSTLKAVTKPFRKGTKESKVSYSSTPLHHACFGGHYDSTALLLKNGAWVNAALDDGKSPLMLGVESGSVPLAQLLLDQGAKINAKTTKHCFTPLHFACYNGNLEMTRLLVAFGADTQALSVGSTPETPSLYGTRGGDKSRAAIAYVVDVNVNRQSSSLHRSYNNHSPMMYNVNAATVYHQSPHQSLATNKPGENRNFFNPQDYQQYFDPQAAPPPWFSHPPQLPSSASSPAPQEKRMFR